jgi:hypothetical protein
MLMPALYPRVYAGVQIHHTIEDEIVVPWALAHVARRSKGRDKSLVDWWSSAGEQQHRTVETALITAQKLLGSWIDSGAGATTAAATEGAGGAPVRWDRSLQRAAADQFAAVHALVTRHLGEEEAVLMPAISKHTTYAEQKVVGQLSGDYAAAQSDAAFGVGMWRDTKLCPDQTLYNEWLQNEVGRPHARACLWSGQPPADRSAVTAAAAAAAVLGVQLPLPLRWVFGSLYDLLFGSSYAADMVGIHYLLDLKE